MTLSKAALITRDMRRFQSVTDYLLYFFSHRLISANDPQYLKQYRCLVFKGLVITVSGLGGQERLQVRRIKMLYNQLFTRRNLKGKIFFFFSVVSRQKTLIYSTLIWRKSTNATTCRGTVNLLFVLSWNPWAELFSYLWKIIFMIVFTN